MLKTILSMGVTKLFGLALLELLLKHLIYPKAEEYVKASGNNYDDIALENMKKLLSDIVAEMRKKA